MTTFKFEHLAIIIVTIAAMSRPALANTDIPVPPLPAAKKAALNMPELIAPTDVKAYIPGLGGFYNSAAHVASINGRVHERCLKYLTLTAGTSTLPDNSFPFALMATSGGLKCLTETSSSCTASDNEKCRSFQALASDPTYGKKFTARVDLGAGVPNNVKVALAKKALILNDKSVKMEATADCCAVAVDPTLGDEKPLSRTATKNIEQIGKITQQIIDQDSVEPKPANTAPATIAMPPAGPTGKSVADKAKSKRDPDDDDDDDEDGNKPRKLAPGMQHVDTDEEIEKKVRAYMLPFEQQFAQSVLAARQQSQLNAMSLQNMMMQSSQPYAATSGGLLNYNFSSVAPNASPLLTSPFTGLGINTGGSANTGLAPATSSPFALPNLGVFK